MVIQCPMCGERCEIDFEPEVSVNISPAHSMKRSSPTERRQDDEECLIIVGDEVKHGFFKGVSLRAQLK